MGVRFGKALARRGRTRFNISMRNRRSRAVLQFCTRRPRRCLPIMGRKMLLAVLWWLALSRCDAGATADSAKFEDSVAEASLPRLYRSIPAGVYASASPYASFSFHIPAFAASPKVTHVGPIKQESAIVENTQGFLKDSYGNKFVESPQSLPYRTAFPQQYVQLQELPAHLAQPLVAAAPSFQYKQLTPHFFGPPQFKVETVQAASPSAANHYAINQPYAFGQIRSLAPAQQQQRQSNNKVIYAKPHEREQYQNLKNVGKSQRLQESPSHYNSNTNGGYQVPQRDRAQLKAVATTNNGKNAAIKLDTKPPVPLLDLSLLEPLTFENPLVPQVQHFLPRISSVKYHKLPELNLKEVKSKMKEIMIQKTKSYDSGVIEDTPKVNFQHQQQRPHPDEDDTEDEQDPPRDPPSGELDMPYKSPNYQESYNEKVLNYNKETQSEPVHYSYVMKSDKEPLTYNYIRTTKAPYKEPVKNENFDKNGQKPKHLIYKFNSEENDDDNNNDHSSQQGESDDSSEEGSKAPARPIQNNQDKAYKESHHDEKPEHREEHQRKPERIVNKKEEYVRKPEKSIHSNVHHNNPREQVETISIHNPKAHIQPILQEYEENIRILPTPKEYETIKVDPNQHVQPQNHDSREPENPDDREQYQPEQQVEEKGKRIIITEETPNPNSKEENEESAEQDGKSEEEFEKGYKKSAYGFPAYQSRDTEKEIYSPEPYAPARYHGDFEVEHSPFERYVAQSDEYPKSTRSNYKDANDKTKERYYLDYAVSKPESMLARYKQKEDYYKMYMDRIPEYLNKAQETDSKNVKSAKYTAAPSYEYHAAAQKPKQYFAKYKAAPRPQAYEYNYAKEAPKDSSAHATGPYQRLKTYTQFVEPQFQYGYEQSPLPRLLDSELSAMASNHRPENEKPLMRKKVYKENWYIKKTSTNGRKADS